MSKTSATTNSILMFLNNSGYKAWAVYNGAVYSIKRNNFLKNPNKLKGVPDINGYRKSDGKAIYIEIKTGKDRLSESQDYFLTEANKAGCITMIVKNYDDFEKQFINQTTP